jgi:hypothetical protein
VFKVGADFFASIGGAGTFDGIFLTGILAVPLASLYARQRAVAPDSRSATVNEEQ